ncbi:MAG TPA: VOC family protein [Candidatus Limnocylindria bacterium]|nr:VOC family protein [Candidatus Limnocylindria bacterium]
MLTDAMAVATIPVTDLEKSLPFYRDVLGLQLLEQNEFALRFGSAPGSQISVFKRPPVERGHTMAHFEVSDIEAEVAAIRSRGGIFEEYDLPFLKTANGIAPLGPTARGAWIKDPDGNVLGLRQGPIPGAK